MRGMAMGIAEVIPGISGGTVALILGVYERLIKAISNFDYELIHLLLERKLNLAWSRIDGNFISILFMGMLLSIYSLSAFILLTMDAYPLAFKSFLSSLLFCSVFIEPLKPKLSRSFFIGLIISLIICSLLYVMPSREMISIGPWYLFFSGFFAVTALVVPGISGSFILLLLGTYSFVLGAVRDLDMEIILIFLSGAVMGLLSIVRVIKLLYEKQQALLLSVFFGLIVFCIPLIWQNQSMDIIYASNPQPFFIGSLLGVVLVLFFKYLGKS